MAHRSADVQVGRRRGKLNRDAEEEGLIKTARGLGDGFTGDPGARPGGTLRSP